MASNHRRSGLTLLELLIVLVILTALGTLLIPTLSWVGERSQRLTTQENLRRLRDLIVNEYQVDMGELPRPRLDQSTATVARRQHPQLVYLFVNPDTHDNGVLTDDFGPPPGVNVLSGRVWNGPYVQHSGMEYFVTQTTTNLTGYTDRYGLGTPTYDATGINPGVGDPAVTDAWGHPIVIQEPTGDSSDDNTISEATLTSAEVEWGRRHTRLVSAGRDGVINTPANALMPTPAERGDDEILFLYRHDEFSETMLDLEP
ncbi:MAG: prepilin-type N-terminal cleavage/methylation domain-containing protein [Pirellulaceae bacterium]